MFFSQWSIFRLTNNFSKWTIERQNSTDEWTYAVQVQKAYVQNINHDYVNLLFEGTLTVSG